MLCFVASAHPAALHAVSGRKDWVNGWVGLGYIYILYILYIYIYVYFFFTAHGCLSAAAQLSEFGKVPILAQNRDLCNGLE